MKKSIICFVIILLAAACTGCDTILEGDRRSSSVHSPIVNERTASEQIEVSNYEELKAAMLELVLGHERDGQMVVFSYDADVQADVDRAVNEIIYGEPRAVYAVSEINATVTRIVSFYEIDVHIVYKRTKEQADSIITMSNLRSLRTELLSIMSEYREEAVFLTSLQVTQEDIAEFVRETYYQNPRSIVMMPVIVVETFEIDGDNRLIELSFRSIEQANVLRQYGASLAGSARLNANVAEGNDAEILLSLVENFIGACSFDEAAARTISEHGVQNLIATAYHALVRGSAVGEGFAMAFKALCDELGFDCRVVLGYRDGMVHAWNIISLYGEYYHIDTAMCAMYGIEAAFLKTDADFIEVYSWDVENTIKCDGSLTYEDIAPVDEDDEDDEDEDGDENAGSGSASGNGSENGNVDNGEPDDDSGDQTDGEEDDTPEDEDGTGSETTPENSGL